MAARPGTAMATGLSLAMLMKLATTDPGLSPPELAAALHQSAQHSVQLGADLLRKGAACGC
jgi:mannose/fructose-specific phosphotransferase system component IIA